jgi:hypothetical protein
MKTFISIQSHELDEVYPTRPWVATVIIPNYKNQTLRGLGARGKSKFGSVVRLLWYMATQGVRRLVEGASIPLAGETHAGK